MCTNAVTKPSGDMNFSPDQTRKQERPETLS